MNLASKLNIIETKLVNWAQTKHYVDILIKKKDGTIWGKCSDGSHKEFTEESKSDFNFIKGAVVIFKPEKNR